MTAEVVNKACLSDLGVVIHIARPIRLGDADVAAMGGQESMTCAPHVTRGVRQGKSFNVLKLKDILECDGLVDPSDSVPIGALTSGLNNDLGISREQQDEVTVASHQHAAKAQEDDTFAWEIASIEVPQCKGGPAVVDTDQGTRSETTVETLARLCPVFLKKNSAITTGNSSLISDGAVTVVLASRTHIEKHGLDHLAVVDKVSQAADPDNSLHVWLADFLKEALRRVEWSAQELDSIEISETSGAVVAKSLRELDHPLEETNIHGGAITLDHPTGCPGVRLTLTITMELNRRSSDRASVSLCGGDGQGGALLLYRDQSLRLKTQRTRIVVSALWTPQCGLCCFLGEPLREGDSSFQSGQEL